MTALYADPTFLSTHADQTLLYRDTAALRMLRLMQAWAANHVVESGRGLIWIAQSWLRAKIGVSRSQYFRALAKLRAGGWIAPSTVADESGRERPGYCVALASAQGFATQMRLACDPDATQMRPRCDSPSSKLNEENLTEGKTLMARDSRQSILPGVHVEELQQHIQAPTKTTTTGKKQRDSRIRVIAARIDDYERERYRHHPRATRPKRDTPQARDISVEAICRAIERVVESKLYDSLNVIEMRFRAVVELNWDSAERKLETWEWWTGSAMWAPNSLERVLGWLEEKRNWVYLERAAGHSVLPMRTDDVETIAPDTDISRLSPLEQQRAYDAAHGIEIEGFASGKRVTFDTVQRRRSGTHSSLNSSTGEITDHIDWDYVAEERRAAEVLSAAIDIEAAAVVLSAAIDSEESTDLTQLVDEMAAQFGLPPQKSDEDLRAEAARKSAYVRSTSPSERADDAKAGRKPWEVE